MNYRCARCHHEFSAEADAHAHCPNCNAEAGLEPIRGIPVPMKLFGMVLAGVVVLALGGGLLSRMMG